MGWVFKCIGRELRFEIRITGTKQRLSSLFSMKKAVLAMAFFEYLNKCFCAKYAGARRMSCYLETLRYP